VLEQDGLAEARSTGDRHDPPAPSPGEDLEQSGSEKQAGSGSLHGEGGRHG
jgi:hypothetical protein